jgi:hypothetical protein
MYIRDSLCDGAMTGNRALTGATIRHEFCNQSQYTCMMPLIDIPSILHFDD